jgi:hypothetical protein
MWFAISILSLPGSVDRCTGEIKHAAHEARSTSAWHEANKANAATDFALPLTLPFP